MQKAHLPKNRCVFLCCHRLIGAGVCHWAIQATDLIKYTQTWTISTTNDVIVLHLVTTDSDVIKHEAAILPVVTNTVIIATGRNV